MKQFFWIIAFVVAMDVTYEYLPSLAILIGVVAAVYAINDSFG